MKLCIRHLTLLLTIAATPLFLATFACGGGGGSSSPSEPPPPGGGGGEVVEVNLDDFEFDPKQVRIEPGDTVRFVLRGTDPNHTATANDGRFASGMIFQEPGDSFEVDFTNADNNMTYEYQCVSHEQCCNMRGSILVGSNAPPPAPGY